VSLFGTSQARAMLTMPPKDPVSSTAVQHSDGVSRTHILVPHKGASFRRGELYVGFAWNLRVMIYTPDVRAEDTV
jgi:hypothetical protein